MFFLSIDLHKIDEQIKSTIKKDPNPLLKVNLFNIIEFYIYENIETPDKIISITRVILKILKA